MGLCSKEKRRLQEELACQHLKKGYRKEEDRLFSRIYCDRTKGSSLKLNEIGYKDVSCFCFFFTIEVGEAVALAAHRGGGAPSPGDK